MSNAFTNQPRYSKDMCQAMRDVNELQVTIVIPQEAVDFCITGNRLFAIFSNNSSVFEYSAITGNYVADFITATVSGINAIDTDGTYIYVVTRKTVTDYQIEKYTLAGSLSTSWSTWDYTYDPAWPQEVLRGDLDWPASQTFGIGNDSDGICHPTTLHCSGSSVYLSYTLYVPFTPPGVSPFPTGFVIQFSNTGNTTSMFLSRNDDGDILIANTIFLCVGGGYVYSGRSSGFIFQHNASSGAWVAREFYPYPIFGIAYSTNYLWASSDTDTYGLGRIAQDLSGTPTQYAVANEEPRNAYAVGADIWCVVVDTADGNAPTIRKYNESGVEQLSLSFGSVQSSQTEFLAYTSTTTGVSMGTPDAGVSVPDLEALSPSDKNAIVADQHLIDVRNAIEALAPFYTNVVTGNPFNWTGASADNLFFVAVGTTYDWTNANASLAGASTYDIDMNEARQCLDKLLDSALA